MDRTTDLSPSDLAAAYPALSAKMEEADKAANEKLDAATPPVVANQEGGAGDYTQVPKADFSGSAPNIGGAVEGGTPGSPVFQPLETSGEVLPAGAGQRPNIELGGEKDPARMQRMNA